MGEIPDWYTNIRAARALGVAPWDLADQPLIWQQWALAAESVEQAAKTELERHETRKGSQNRVRGRRGK